MSAVLQAKRRVPTTQRHPARWLARFWLPGLDPLARAGYLCLIVLIAGSIVGGIGNLAGDPQRMVALRLQPPSGSEVLGTDALGRSLLPRVVEGLQTTLTLSVVAVLIAVGISVGLGSVAGYLGGWRSEVVMRGLDIFYAFPALILAILVSAVVGYGRGSEVVSIVLVTVPLMTRVIRASALSICNQEYVVAARISGANGFRIVWRHVIPNLFGTIVVQATYALSVAMLVEGGLSFLGLGVQAPDASLGSLVQDGGIYLTIAPWIALVPGGIFVLAVLSINVLGDGLRDLLDPQEVRSLV